MKNREELIEFRKAAKAKVDPIELLRLKNSINKQNSELGQCVAEVMFEEKCLEQFRLFCIDLRQAGYTTLWIDNPVCAFYSSELRAKPKMGAYSPIAPLWTIAKRYFPEATSCGGDADSDIQCLALSFPECLVGVHDLRESTE